jgi:tRNA nucleotidyltransferase (CCA-adding enzyme)
MKDSFLSCFLRAVGNFAKEKNLEIYIVGGYTREKVLAEIQARSFEDLNYRDVDLVVNSDAIQFVKDFFEESDFELLATEVFRAFKTIKIKVKGLEDYEIEFASTREESYPSPSAFPLVNLISDIKKDLLRRDFTINALLMSLMPENFGEILDYVGAMADLKAGLIRVFHDKSFIDDSTRVFRAIRFKAKYDFKIEPHTLSLMRTCCQHPDYPLWREKRKGQFRKEEERIKEICFSSPSNESLPEEKQP